MSDTDWFCYIALADCGCLAAVHVDEPDHRKEVAKFIAEQVRHGFVIERMRGDVFRTYPWRCGKHPDGRWPK